MFTVPALPSSTPTDPAVFLSTDQGGKWANELATSYPHTRYERDRSTTFSLKDCDKFAAAIIDAKRTGESVDTLLADEIRPASFRDTWRYVIQDDLKTTLRDHFDDRDVEEEWEDSVYPAWRETASNNDDSKVTDLFASYDYCELLFRFSEGEYVEDTMITSHRPWSEFSELAVTPDLQFALTNLGYTVSQYRAASKNRHEAWRPLAPRRARRAPIVTLDQVEELVDNACSQYFHFYLFAIVPLTDVIALDLTKPITFEKAWVATANCYSGTFHEVPANGPVTVNPTDGTLISGGHMAYSPDSVCGLHTPHFHARARN